MVIEQKGAIIKKENLPKIHALSSQLHQLFFNLINNALKFSRKDVPPEVIVCATQNIEHLLRDKKLDGSRSYTLIQVKDNGIGFEPKYAQQIFELFKRLHGRHEYEGTGIGLALCKKIVENHHGEIWAQSEPGIGSTFNILFPVSPR